MTDKPWPTLVRIGNSQVPVLINRKAYRKSLENNSPWIVHPGTGRVLPWPGKPGIIRLEEGPSCYLMELPPGTNMYPYGEAPPPKVDPDERTDMNPAGEAALENACSDGQSRMHTLARIVAERRQVMPEGSYTTHLFSSGPDKIRKKLGEEAVELILAKDNKDVIYESADLLYHLQVLLSALDIAWTDVEAELNRRHNQEN